jgi:hypothetical protein
MSMRSYRLLFSVMTVLLFAHAASARNPIRREFFSIYPTAEGTQLDDLLSNAGHCGVCHFDFDGGGQRNPYGLAVEVGLQAGLSNEQAILAAAPSIRTTMDSRTFRKSPIL